MSTYIFGKGDGSTEMCNLCGCVHMEVVDTSMFCSDCGKFIRIMHPRQYEQYLQSNKRKKEVEVMEDYRVYGVKFLKNTDGSWKTPSEVHQGKVYYYKAPAGLRMIVGSQCIVECVTGTQVCEVAETFTNPAYCPISNPTKWIIGRCDVSLYQSTMVSEKIIKEQIDELDKEIEKRENKVRKNLTLFDLAALDSELAGKLKERDRLEKLTW